MSVKKETFTMLPKNTPLPKVFAFFYFLSGTHVLAGVLDQSCIGYDCLKDYIDLEDGAYKWEDTGRRIHVAARWKRMQNLKKKHLKSK